MWFYQRGKIITRLQARLDQGLVQEVAGLIDNSQNPGALSRKRLDILGLEYREGAAYQAGEITLKGMQNHLALRIALCAQRQRTWFLDMERRGVHFHWIPSQVAKYSIKSSKNGIRKLSRIG